MLAELFDSLNNKDALPTLNSSNGIGTVNYDAHIKRKTKFSIYHIYKSTTSQELNILRHICESEITHLLTMVAQSVQNLQVVGCLLTGNHSNFLYVEVSTA